MHNIFCYTNDANNINERNTMTHAGGTMDTEELRHILDQHTLWIRSEGGKRADLTDANLYRADLTGADLTGADLTDANLYRADLTRADLTGANLTDADLTRADLTRADLTRADLTGADLTDANLTDANLTRADLTRADLTGADLTRAKLTGAAGAFAMAYLGKHHAVAAGGYICIGCERRTYAEWLEKYTAIGQRNGYTPDEIERYGDWIKLVVGWLAEEHHDARND